MSHVLVTGGTGYVGRFIVEGLLAAGHDVTVAGRAAPAADIFSAPVAFRPLDLDPDAENVGLFDGIDHCVHAAFHHVSGKYRGGEGDDPATFRRLNGDGSARLFAAAKTAGVKRCVFLSTRAVYGTQPPGAPLDEETPCRPDTLYGAVKLQAEAALAALSDARFCGTNLRVTGVYGQPRPGAWHKWQDLFADYLAGRPVAARAGTEVHGRDVAGAVELMLTARESEISDRSFNVSDIVVDRHDLLAIVRDICGTGQPLPERAEAGDLNAMTTSRLESLGWRAGGWQLLKDSVLAMIDRP